jgi:hypothetical protein
MQLSKEKAKEFQELYSQNYGTHISEERVEEVFLEITQLLKTIIQVNHKQ